MALLRLAFQSVLLYGVFWSASFMVGALHLPLPANLVGLLLLLGLLWSGLIKPSQLDVASGLVSRHLSFFFVPLAVGVMAWGGLLASSGVILGVALLASAALGIGVGGLTAQSARRLTDATARPTPAAEPAPRLMPFPAWSFEAQASRAQTTIAPAEEAALRRAA